MALDKQKLEALPEIITLAGFSIERRIYIDRLLLSPDESKQFVQHSEGFDWGYKGSGPAQLAFAILYHFFKDEALVKELYQTFKILFVAQLGLPDSGNFHVEVKLREFVSAMVGIFEVPQPPSYFIKPLELDFSIIRVRGYAGGYRQIPSTEGNIVANKVNIISTGPDTYDVE